MSPAYGPAPSIPGLSAVPAIVLPERIFTPGRVAQYLAEQESDQNYTTQRNIRSILKSVGRASTRLAMWPPLDKPYRDHIKLKPPYTPEEIAAFWALVPNQKERPGRVLRALLVLCHGAGLSAEDVLGVTAHDVEFWHLGPFATIKAAGRLVPVLTQCADELRALCLERPRGRLIGNQPIKANDRLANYRKGIVIPPYLPRLTISQLRITYFLDVLRNGASLAEVEAITGTTSKATLAAITPYTGIRIEDEAYLHIAAGLPRP
ncbi:hypothetical protein [Brachybacterium epidermidis]|uniref:hypothetical protein n=1 Tax=Brachybacterium epidermidis TaxID=2781983 RepID=UPI00398E64FF